MPTILIIALVAVGLMAVLAPWIVVWRERKHFRAHYSSLQAQNNDLVQQVKRLKHRTNVLARALSERDDTPNTPDGYVRQGLSADFRDGGARPAMVSAESYIHDDEIGERRATLLAVKPTRRGPPVLPPDLLDEYRKSAVNE